MNVVGNNGNHGEIVKTLIAVLAVKLVMVGSIFLLPLTAQPAEDSPDWNCHTMGNRICGPAR